MSRAIPPPLLTAVTAAVPPEQRPKLIAEWAITLAENENRAEWIRAQVTLSDDQLDAIAERIAAKLAAQAKQDEAWLGSREAEQRRRAPAHDPLVDAATLACALGVSRDWVYAHAVELGGQRIGAGPRGRLRFDLDRALEAWTSRSESGGSRKDEAPAQTRISHRARSPRMGSGPELLPIRGSATAPPPHTEVS
jgi:hypothetical protein